MGADDVLAIAAAHQLGMVRTDQWPMVAAILVGAGHDGEALVELAGLSPAASGWQVDQLVPRALAEVGTPDLDLERTDEVVVRLLAAGLSAGSDHPIIRALAPFALGLDYPGGRIGQAYYLSEWLDCECHEGSQERVDADRFEEEVRQLPPLDIEAALAHALTCG